MATTDEIRRTLANNLHYGVSHALGILEYYPNQYMSSAGFNKSSLSNLYEIAAQKTIELTAAQLEPEPEANFEDPSSFYSAY